MQIHARTYCKTCSVSLKKLQCLISLLETCSGAICHCDKTYSRFTFKPKGDAWCAVSRGLNISDK